MFTSNLFKSFVDMRQWMNDKQSKFVDKHVNYF